jgi:hypothetical protein
MKAFLAAVLLAVIVLPACKKDRTQPQQPSIERNVVIEFTAATIPISQADSASVIMKKEGSNTPYFRRFDKASGKMHLVMDDNLKGNWTAVFYVYTTEGNNQHLYQRNVGFSLPLSADMKLFAPDAQSGLWDKIF